MNDRIHRGAIDEASILEWGYDEDMLFDEQDEDLVLGVHHEHYPILAKLALDPECPKADYCLSIMDFSLMFRVLRKAPGAAIELEKTIELVRGSTRPRVVAFISANERRLEMLRGKQLWSREQAVELGQAALNGVSRNADITVTDQGTSWLIELSIPPFHRHKERLTLSKASGEYSFGR